MDMVEIIKSCPQQNTHVDEISPLLKTLLSDIPHDNTVKLLEELARPATSPSSPPPVVKGGASKKIREFIDNLPTKIIPFFQDMTAEMFEARFQQVLDLDISCMSRPKTVCVTADVSPFRKDRIKVFVVGNLVMVTGTEKDDSDPYPVPSPTPQQMVTLPHFPYLHRKVTASIIRDKLRIIFPRLDDDDSAVVNKPKVFQVNLS
ncbi:uncharacterized protein [Rutidosis leptorrhynchoides]|uniref:uncharacterized protein n=1 Tax=Rutidosis leptorrhynchoides TaxID=125765 RepID=UPI003A9A383B